MADTTRKDPAKKPSVTSHKLFPAVVTVWFAALFGLASLAIRPASIEGVVLATGIDHVIAQAAPPLGNTMRILLALLMTGLGAVLGLIVARRLAKPKSMSASTKRRRRVEAIDDSASPVAAFGRKEPIVTVDDDGDEVQPIARRRQQLALLDDDDSTDNEPPVPVNGHILDVTELPLKSFDEVDGIWLHESDRSTPPRDYEPQGAHANGSMPDLSANVADVAEFLEDARADAHAGSIDGAPRKSNIPLFDSYVRRLNAGVGSNDSDATAPGFVSLEPIAAIQDDDLGDIGEAPALEQNGEAKVAQPSPPSGSQPTPTYGNAAERIASAPLHDLSHVELLERLALTIARRRAERSAPAEPAFDRVPVTPAAEQAAPEETRLSDMATVTVLPRFAAPPARSESVVPAALRPHWADMQDDDDALPAYVPPRSIASPKAAQRPDPLAPADAKAADPEVEKAELLEDGYFSLRGMSKATPDTATTTADEPEHDDKRPLPRFAFPMRQADIAPPSPAAGPRMFDAPQGSEPVGDQTEQALRAALATLRRMSGTA